MIWSPPVRPPNAAGESSNRRHLFPDSRNTTETSPLLETDIASLPPRRTEAEPHCYSFSLGSTRPPPSFLNFVPKEFRRLASWSFVLDSVRPFFLPSN
ncbi:hypothetical protein LINPERPRIM_LOCUS25226 [Linum perenne]